MSWGWALAALPRVLLFFSPFNLRVLINVGKVICQVCFACGFLRLKATGNSSSVRRAGAVLLSPEGGFSSADSRRLQLLIRSYWILTHHSQQSYGLAALDPMNWDWLCLQHLLPLPFQFLLNLSLQMSISFCKGQAVISSSSGCREKALMMMPSAIFYSILLQFSNCTLSLLPSLSQPHSLLFQLTTIFPWSGNYQ